MTIDQIIEMWKNVGWNNLNEYHDYLKNEHDYIELKALDPDVIDPKIFWKAAEIHFGTDPVCNQNRTPNIDAGTLLPNYYNDLLPIHLGMTGQTHYLCATLVEKFNYVRIGEIGCGYGAFRKNSYLSIQKRYLRDISYVGFDVLKRTPDTVELMGSDGTFSDSQIKEYKDRINLFYSSNVFQHLSINKIQKYLNQVYDILPFGGYFNLMYVSNTKKTYHYGQYNDIMSEGELKFMIKETGYTIAGYTKMDFINSLSPYSIIIQK
jgi:hypothetical protein